MQAISVEGVVSPSPIPYRQLLVRYVRPLWHQSVVLLALLLLSTGLQIVTPQIVRYYIDTASSGGGVQLLTLAGVAYLGVAIITQAVRVIDTYVAENLGWNITNTLRGDLIDHCLCLDMRFHTMHTPGEMIERIDGDVMLLSNFFTCFVIVMLGTALLLIGVLVVLFVQDWRVGLVFTIFVIGALAIFYTVRNVSTAEWERARQSSADLFGYLEERLGGVEDIRANGGGDYALRRLYERLRANLRFTNRANVIGVVTPFVLYVCIGAGEGLTFSLGGPLRVAGTITIGTMYLFYMYLILLVLPLTQIGNQINDLQQASAGLRRIQHILQTSSAIKDGPGVDLPARAPSIEFVNVSFAYQEEEAALQGISFSLARGRVLGLLGRTGSGKTTITRLLMRFYDPATGSIRLDRFDLQAFKVADLRRQIGVVTQDVQLFHATVRDNLTLFDNNVSDARIVDVLETLGLGAWLKRLSHGLDTMLAGDADLSAGEAQLLAFARVFLADPKLVILDEASSRLDLSTMQLVESAVDTLLQGRTAIVIAHRLETIARADEILILNQGKIQEYGERVQLAGDVNSRFYYLLHSGKEIVEVLE